MTRYWWPRGICRESRARRKAIAGHRTSRCKLSRNQKNMTKQLASSSDEPVLLGVSCLLFSTPIRSRRQDNGMKRDENVFSQSLVPYLIIGTPHEPKTDTERKKRHAMGNASIPCTNPLRDPADANKPLQKWRVARRLTGACIRRHVSHSRGNKKAENTKRERKRERSLQQLIDCWSCFLSTNTACRQGPFPK